MVDETDEGSLFAALRMREADLDKHLNSGQGAEVKDPAREKARDEARKDAWKKKLKKPPAERKVPEFGSDKDFQLAQALNQLKGRPSGQQDHGRAQGREEGKLIRPGTGRRPLPERSRASGRTP